MNIFRVSTCFLITTAFYEFTYAQPRMEAQIVAPRMTSVPSNVTYDKSEIRGPGGYRLILQDDSREVFGFKFENNGGNHIIPKVGSAGSGSQRAFSFEFYNRAIQDITLKVIDSPDEKLSHMLVSYLYFFPRKNLPAIQSDAFQLAPIGFTNVILPTGETISFRSNSKEIVDGVLKETRPLDESASPSARAFAGLEYTGSGVMIRVDARGKDPRFQNKAQVFFRGQICTVPSALLFNQNQNSRSEFKFVSDADLNEFLKNKCQFSFL